MIKSASSCQLVEQRLSLFQVERVETFGELAIDRSGQFASLMLPLITPEPREAHCGDKGGPLAQPAASLLVISLLRLRRPTGLSNQRTWRDFLAQLLAVLSVLELLKCFYAGNLMITTRLGGCSPANEVVLFMPPARYSPPFSLIAGITLGKNCLA